MDPNSSVDRQLFDIARQGLMEPVPEPWEAQRDANDMILYYNNQTGEETHQHPCDEAYRRLFKQRRNSLLKARGKEPDQDVDEAESETDAADQSKSRVTAEQENYTENAAEAQTQATHIATGGGVMKSGKSHKTAG